MNNDNTSTPPNTPVSAIPPNVLAEMGGNAVARRDSVMSVESNETGDSFILDPNGRRRSLRKKSVVDIRQAAANEDAKAKKEEQEKAERKAAREAKEKQRAREMEIDTEMGEVQPQAVEKKKPIKKDVKGKGKKKVVVQSPPRPTGPNTFHSGRSQEEAHAIMNQRLADLVGQPVPPDFRLSETKKIEYRERNTFNREEVAVAQALFDMGNQSPYEALVGWEESQARIAHEKQMMDNLENDVERNAVKGLMKILAVKRNTERDWVRQAEENREEWEIVERRAEERRAEKRRNRDIKPLPKRTQIEQTGLGVKVSTAREEPLRRGPIEFTNPFPADYPPAFETDLATLPVPCVPSQVAPHQPYFPPQGVPGPAGVHQHGNYNYHPNPGPNTSTYHGGQHYQGGQFPVGHGYAAPHPPAVYVNGGMEVDEEL